MLGLVQSKGPGALLSVVSSEPCTGLTPSTGPQISGGPVYVSDKPGHHDFPLLKRLVLSDGTLLRCSQVGRPTLDTLFEDVTRDERSLLKVGHRSLLGCCFWGPSLLPSGPVSDPCRDFSSVNGGKRHLY